MKTQKRSYTLEFKIKAVELSNQRGALASVAQELNISPDNLKRWKKEFTEGKLTAQPKQKSLAELELIRLNKELAEIKMERDILKKAVCIFSKSDR